MRAKISQCCSARIVGLYLALAVWWKGWRSVVTDPPPIGLRVLALCDYTGYQGTTIRRDGIKHLRWDSWYINQPTHWRNLPDALPLAQEPPGLPVLIEITEKTRR